MNGIYPLIMTNIAIESFPIKNGGSFHSYVRLPEDTNLKWMVHDGHPYFRKPLGLSDLIQHNSNLSRIISNL